MVVDAQANARELDCNYISDSHVLLGVAMSEGVASETLTSLGITYEAIRAELMLLDGPGNGAPPADQQIPFTPRAKKALELALREALSIGHNYVGTEHLLLGLVRDDESQAVEILLKVGATPDGIREEVFRILSKGGRRRKREAAKPPKPEKDEGIEAVPTHHDRPATQDELGRARLAEVLGERMRRVRGEDTEAPVHTPEQRRRKRRADAKAARRAGSFMVHIHAPWGAGKSSLLNFLATDLRNRSRPASRTRLGKVFDFLIRRRQTANRQLSRWIVVEFSAWEHQRLVAPWWWLLTAIQRSCARELWQINRGRWAWFWLRDIAWRVWNARAAVLTFIFLVAVVGTALALDWFGLADQSLSVVRTAIVTVSSAIALAITIVGLSRGASRWLAIGSAEGAVRFLKRAHDPLGVYRRRFRWLVRSSGLPITVFIDDLDRCKPAYVVELLEGIQTLFADEPVAYVVAADRTWLCESFAKAYCDFEHSVGDVGRPLGFLFLEKTFQISMEIPPMSEQDQGVYWETLLRGARNGDRRGTEGKATESRRALAEASSQAEIEKGVKDLIRDGADREKVLAAAVRRMNAPQLQDQLEQLLSEFAPLLENNPRSMKRLMNAYGIERDRLLRNGHLLTRQERRQLALLTILRLRWPLFADHLRRFPEDAKICAPLTRVPKGHPFADLLKDPAVQALFDGSCVAEQIDADVLRQFPAAAPAKSEE